MSSYTCNLLIGFVVPIPTFPAGNTYRIITIPEPPVPLIGLADSPSPHDPPPPPVFAIAFIKLFIVALLTPLPPPPLPPKGILARPIPLALKTLFAPAPPPAKYTLFSVETY